MDPKLEKFTYILIFINIFTTLYSSAYQWIVNDVDIHANPVFQTSLLFMIAGLLFNLTNKKALNTPKT
ncbi:hypothetical protein [Aliiglaciecola litoralis]|uniref:Holin n=1 Tax=Aliiglaciecola litoralis TaxID=582857 RepID=A0ABN1LEV6_9ALTE